MSSTAIVLDQFNGASDEAQRLVDAERRSIARELHDVVGFSFAAISVHAGVAVHLAEERPDVAFEALRKIKAISVEAARELGEILEGLRVATGAGDAPCNGLAGLETLAATVADAGLPTRVFVSGQARSLPPAVDRAAYRIAQEALTNALRHAGPASAVVTVRYEPDRLVLEVIDDGRGLVLSDREREPGPGQGIAGMRERAQALGGELDAGPCSPGGFRVRAVLLVGVQS